MVDRETIGALLRKRGYSDFRWISGVDLEVRQWVRLKCMFGCDSYGRRGSCPPHVPSLAECKELFSEYQDVAVIRITAKFDNPDDRKEWSRQKNLDLVKLEREVFLAGCEKVFLLIMDECRVCTDCPGARLDCRHPKLARPSPEALGVDVFSTVRPLGYPIEVLTDYRQEMNRYAFLLVA
jgi:predicted metal-binding protein